ncbi:hypothetical protein SMICM17S_07334 [Streptomyces microflavus]
MLQNSGLKGFGDLWRVVNGCGGVLVICAVWSEEVKVFSFFLGKAVSVALDFFDRCSDIVCQILQV